MSTATTWVDDHIIAGDVVLDFANTVYRRTPEPGADLFNNIEALTTWLARVNLLPATENPRGVFVDPGTALGRARALRELFWTVFDAREGGRQIPTKALADLLDTARRGITDTTFDSAGAMTPLGADGVLAVLALRGILLVLDPLPRRVRACDSCGWFFIDTSRGRRRRWCSMKTCGNQNKAARFRSQRATRSGSRVRE